MRISIRGILPQGPKTMVHKTELKLSRQNAARRCVAVFDTGFFKALCEPARIAVLRELILLGRGDIAAIAARLPQDRSVVARHLQQLAAAQIVRASKEGRHVFYQIDAGSVAERLEGILAITRLLESAMSADSGMATTAKIPQPRKPIGKDRSHAR
jgi:DNA-binding transcriptional ArsR family regulator